MKHRLNDGIVISREISFKYTQSKFAYILKYNGISLKYKLDKYCLDRELIKFVTNISKWYVHLLQHKNCMSYFKYTNILATLKKILDFLLAIYYILSGKAIR